MKTLFVKKLNQIIVPVDQINAELFEDLKNGEYKIDISRPRNLPFHRKFFALLQFSYRNWDVEETRKDFEKFREKVTILAGHCKEVWNLDGTLELQAESISFSKMEDVEFEAFYSKVVDVIIGHVLKNYSKDDLEEVVLQVLRFS
jgi:Protein of unknown function (DUF1367)